MRRNRRTTINTRRLQIESLEARTLMTAGLSASGDQLFHQDTPGIKELGEYRDNFGAAVATGDFNGDGHQDLVVGAPGEQLGSYSRAGAVHVVYGTARGLTTAGDRIFHQAIGGMKDHPGSNDLFGHALGVGDFNRDGCDDLAIGVPGESVGRVANAGAVQVLYGSPDGLTTLDRLWHLESTGIPGRLGRGDRFGESLTVGDFDRDGYADLAVGAPGDSLKGSVTLIYGSPDGLTSEDATIWTQDSPGVKGVGERGDQFGYALAAGDFNQDGYADLAIGAPGDAMAQVNSGSVNVLYGSRDGVTPDRDQIWHQDSPDIFGGAEPGDQFGYALTTGDFDGDGRSDLAIGVPGEEIGSHDDAGSVNVLYGSSDGLTAGRNRLWNQWSSDDTGLIVGGAEPHDRFGESLTAGDFNRDGIADLAIGVPGEWLKTLPRAGAVNVVYGSRNGLAASGNQLWHQDAAGVKSKARAEERFGAALASGDFNGDGVTDLVVGVPNDYVDKGDEFPTNAGAVNILAGTSEAAANPGLAVPVLHSNPTARHTLYLDFDGIRNAMDGKDLLPMDFDGDRFTFDRYELDLIRDIHTRVSEDFSPFDVNVTTVDPRIAGVSGTALKRVWTVAAGDLDGESAVNSGCDGCIRGVPVAWSEYIGPSAARIATTMSHETGHRLGLEHQSDYDSAGNLIQPLGQGGTDWTPIMGDNLATDRTVWVTGRNVEGNIQDDVAVIARKLGYRQDERDGIVLGSNGTAAGVISSATDTDLFWVYHLGGMLSVNVEVTGSLFAKHGKSANLDAVLELRDWTRGVTMTRSAPSGQLNASLDLSLPAGSYLFSVGSDTSPGSLGQYSISVDSGVTANNGSRIRDDVSAADRIFELMGS